MQEPSRDGRRCPRQLSRSGILIEQARAEHHADDQRRTDTMINYLSVGGYVPPKKQTISIVTEPPSHG